jgi:hypothetical protein
MNQNIRKRMISIFLTLTMVLGMLPAFTLQANAAYPDPFTASVNTITAEVSDPNAQPTPFYIGNAMHFEDGNDSLYVPYQLTSATDNITMETWVKADTVASAGTYTRIMYNGNSGMNGYGIYLEGPSKAVTILLGGVTFLYPVTPVYLSSGQWYHLAIVRDAGIWKLYVNGEEKPLLNCGLAPNVPNEIFSVGNSPIPNENFIGCIDESRFWEVARSAQQIRDNMYIKLKGTEPGLLAYYNYDQAGVVPNGDNRSVTSVKNVKAGGTDLTISGFNLYGETSNFVPSVNLGAFQLDSTSYSVSKGQEKVSVAINRIGGSEGTVVINYVTMNGTASAGSNYTSTSGSLTFASGETVKTVDIPILANNTGGELTFTFSISAQQGVSFGSNTAATICLANRAGLNHLPVASSVQINGTMYVGNTVHGDYVYSDADGDVMELMNIDGIAQMIKTVQEKPPFRVLQA